MTAPHTRDSIRDLLRTNDRALCRAVLAIYRRQMADEQAAQSTHYNNGVGFTAADARVMTQIAQTLIADDYILDTVDMATARERMPKYAGQLLEIAMAKVFGL